MYAFFFVFGLLFVLLEAHVVLTACVTLFGQYLRRVLENQGM